MLVTCVTPTFNRREFWPRCVRCFLSQDWPDLEWVIADNGDDPVDDLVPVDPRVRYHRLAGGRLTHGQLMNECFERASGEVCIVHDDDDWYAPDRVSRQVRPLAEDPAAQVSGTSELLYVRHGSREAYRYVNLTAMPWMGAIAVRRSAWEVARFGDKKAGAEYAWLQQVPRGAWRDLRDPTLLVSTIHDGNTCPKRLPSPSFRPEPWDTVQRITGGTL